MWIFGNGYEQALKTQNDNIEMLIEKNKNLEKRLAVLEDIRERKQSDEPWVEVLGGDVDPEKGLQMKLDWNDAFIDQLRAQGYKGTTEGALVAQWLLNVSNAVKPEDDK